MSVQHRIESTVKQLEVSNQARSMQIPSSEFGWIHFCRGMGKGASLTCSGSTTCYSARTATLLDAATSGIGLVHAQTVWPSGCKSLKYIQVTTSDSRVCISNFRDADKVRHNLLLEASKKQTASKWQAFSKVAGLPSDILAKLMRILLKSLGQFRSNLIWES